MTVIHPGSIQVRVGSCLAKIELNIEQADILGMSNFVKLLVAYVSPYFPDHPDLKERLETIPPFSYAKDESAAFADEMKRIEVALLILRKESIFGYDKVPVGDGSALMDLQGDNVSLVGA